MLRKRRERGSEPVRGEILQEGERLPETRDCSRGGHVRMEQRGHKLALWWLGGVLVAELHRELEQAAKPLATALARDTALPLHQVC